MSPLTHRVSLERSGPPTPQHPLGFRGLLLGAPGALGALLRWTWDGSTNVPLWIISFLHNSPLACIVPEYGLLGPCPQTVWTGRESEYLLHWPKTCTAQKQNLSILLVNEGKWPNACQIRLVAKGTPVQSSGWKYKYLNPWTHQRSSSKAGWGRPGGE